MRLVALIMLYAIASQSNAAVVGVALTEGKTHSSNCYSFDSETSKLVSINCGIRNEIKNTGPFSVQAGKLVSDKRQYGPATELLYQADIGDTWIILIRQEYNSYSSFKKLLSAFSGHPIQVSKIVILSIKNDAVSSETVITEKASLYHWDAKAYKMGQTNEHTNP